MTRSDSYFWKTGFCSSILRSYVRIFFVSVLLTIVIIPNSSTGLAWEKHRNGSSRTIYEETHSIEPDAFHVLEPAGGVIQRHSGDRNELYPQPSSLAQVYDRLAAGADNGDRLSTCLLSRALALCDKESNQEAATGALIDSAARSEPGSDDELRFLEFIAKTWPMSGSQSKMCRGLSASRLREKDARMLQAAQLGDPLAMTHFALRSRTSDMDENVGNDFDEEYRANAVAMLDHSASVGDFTALRELFMMYLYGLSPNRSGIAVVNADPTAALAIASALFQSIGSEQKDRIASLLAEEGVSVETVDMKRYKALERKYLGYSKANPISGFDDRGENTEIEQCWTLR
jgi:hypothetical protein